MILNAESNSNIIVIGSGRSISDYREQIRAFVVQNNCVTLGINNMTSLLTPKYHLWTNTKQFHTFHKCISKKSKLLLGEKLSNNSLGYKHEIIKVVEGEKTSVVGDIIHGNFRTAGALGIMVAHVLGAKHIYIVGMDGFTLYREEDLRDGKSSQHCYGQGYTDDADWERCIEKDRKVQENLQSIRNVGINFSIITPTKFKQFFDREMLP